MSAEYFIESLIIGFTIAAIVGPIGLLCIKKTLEHGMQAALLVGLGAAMADATYGLIAGLGLSMISNILINQSLYIKLLGGLFLIYLAYQEIKPHKDKAAVSHSDIGLKLAIEVFVLTLMNPLTILSFIAIFASIANGPTSVWQSSIMVLGVFLGSMVWWIILGGIITKIRHKLSSQWKDRIRYCSAFILFLFGISAVINAIY